MFISHFFLSLFYAALCFTVILLAHVVYILAFSSRRLSVRLLAYLLLVLPFDAFVINLFIFFVKGVSH